MQSRWDEAAAANRAIIEIFPTDVDALNRLGKALTEMGRYAEARDAYSQALAIDSNNTIAKKNLARLAHLKEPEAALVGAREKVDPHLFIEETGKTGVATLQEPAPKETLASVTAGDQVYLKVDGRGLVVVNARGEYLGKVEPKMALRLVNLMAGGNEYAAAIMSLGDSTAKVIIKETYQHPSQAGRLSFPSKAIEGFRPYIRESVLKYELEEEEEGLEEGEYGAEWEEEAEPSAEEVQLYEEDSITEDKEDEFGSD
jgi:tetratricopeptide (TPR) repeat protein